MNLKCKCINKDLKIALIGCGVILSSLYYFIKHEEMEQYDDNNDN